MSKAKDFLEVISEGLSTADMHKLKEARESLAKSCAGVKLSGAINHSEAIQVIESLTGNKTERAGCACGKKTDEDTSSGKKEPYMSYKTIAKAAATGDFTAGCIARHALRTTGHKISQFAKGICKHCGKNNESVDASECVDCKNSSPKKDESASERVARMLAGAEAKVSEDITIGSKDKHYWAAGDDPNSGIPVDVRDKDPKCVSCGKTVSLGQVVTDATGNPFCSDACKNGSPKKDESASESEAGDDLLAAAALLISAANDAAVPAAVVVEVPAAMQEDSMNKGTVTQDVNGHDVHTSSSNDTDNGKAWSTTVFWNGTDDKQVGPEFNSEAEAMQHHQEVVDGIKSGSLKQESEEQTTPARKFTFEDLKGFKNLKKEQSTNESSEGADLSYMQRMFGG